MIVADTSALVRMFLREPGFERVRATFFKADQVGIPLSCVVEFTSLPRLNEDRHGWLEIALDSRNVVVLGHDPEQRALAISAAQRYGKGSGHPAGLNFGDCLVYAVAKYRDLPLLFAGDDFTHTDITPALDSST